jgi:heme/copper-type cytochrome/quinol oxidase subunit 2
MWVGLVAAVVVVVVVLVALLGVVRRFRASRGAEPRQLSAPSRIQLPVVAVLGALALALFVIGVVLTDQARETPSSGDAGLASAQKGPLEIEATGQQWLWRYNYPNGAFSYYKLVVPADTAVKLKLRSTDVIHTWDVGDLAGKADAVPGKTHDVVFSSDREGVYQGKSATLSGQAYAQMRTEVEVVSPEEYEAWTEKQKEDIDAAQENVVQMFENGEVP